MNKMRLIDKLKIVTGRKLSQRQMERCREGDSERISWGIREFFVKERVFENSLGLRTRKYVIKDTFMGPQQALTASAMIYDCDGSPIVKASVYSDPETGQKKYLKVKNFETGQKYLKVNPVDSDWRFLSGSCR
jgi:hypothetical protein